MSDVIVLMSESFRRAGEITIFIEFSRVRDHTTRVTDMFARIHEALYGEMYIGHIQSL